MGRVLCTDTTPKSRGDCLRKYGIPLGAAAVTAALLWLAFYTGSYVPFGANTPAVTDAKLQYLDLFAYYRDVLTGNNTVDYTFSNTLGGSAVAIWAYYLASPFNLLVVLFPKEQMNLFLEVLITVKLSAASASFAWFVVCRFRNRIRSEIVLILSVSYGLMQYMLAQGSNVMWLDGVILLPFIVLGVHRTMRAKDFKAEHRAMLLLSISAAATVVANWYTGGINYLFSLVWLIYENARCKGLKDRTKKILRFLAGIGLGLLLASVVFVPNVLALRQGKGAMWNPAEPGNFLSAGLRGNPLSVLRSYRIGEISDSARVSFFCGSFALFGTAAFFSSGRIGRREKAAGAGLLLFTVMSCFWQPLFVLFSLFQDSNSYWYRYGYLGSFVLLYLAAYWAGSLYREDRAGSDPHPAMDKGEQRRRQNREKRQSAVILKAGAASLLIVLGSQWIWSSGGSGSTRTAVMILIGITALMLVPRRGSQRAAAAALTVLCAGEMFLQTQAMLGIYHTDTAGEYAAYSRQEQEQIGNLLQFDREGFYRVNQTSTRIGNKDGLTAAYLDAMAYGYASVSGYTSCPENIQLDFLDRLGYRKEYQSFNIVNTSFLPADSLLGVRYVLSSYGIPGLREVKELGQHNGKAVYENPFVLPAAMILERGGEEKLPEEPEDPFECLERIYGSLSGQKGELFVPAEYSKEQEKGKTIWTITVPNGKRCLYGNLPWEETMEGRLLVSDEWGFGYGDWLSPSVFYIPVEESAETVRVILETPSEPDLKKEQFYALDLDRLAQAAMRIRERSEAVRELEITSGRITCTADAADGQDLVLSVPASSGWEVRVNGSKTEYGLFEGCLVRIPLVQGENRITMRFRVPGRMSGIILTLAGAGILTVYLRRKERKSK